MHDMQEHKERSGAQLLLVLGGARSGKSTFAEQLAKKSGRSVAFIATATASDEDMLVRIQRHRSARPPDWQTFEEALHLSVAVKQAAQVADVLLLDCMTVWLSNWLFAQGDMNELEAIDMAEQVNESALAEIETLLHLLTTLPASQTLVVVTNEVGLGIVPAYALGRLYRDVLGRVNQRLAATATRVYLLVAGLGVDIKRLHEQATL
jgi:adenosylcobinamide kinase/adenosylcobinamide-phosphate guanylyltransferase